MRCCFLLLVLAICQGPTSARPVAIPVVVQQRHLLQQVVTGDLFVVPAQDATFVPPINASGQGAYLWWEDLISGGSTLMEGNANPQPSLDDCAKSCMAEAQCNTFVYCPLLAGCNTSLYDHSVAHLGCKLINQALSGPDTGRPINVGEAPGFQAGAPMRFKLPPDIEGYSMVPGVGFYQMYDYSCETAAEQFNGKVCGMLGTAMEWAATCNADPACRAINYFPLGRDYSGKPYVVFKGGPGVSVNVSTAVVNANAVAYFKLAPPANDTAPDSGSSSGGGLSTGAIVGIAVGAACGVALVAAAAAFLLLRRKQQKAAAAGGRKPASDQTRGETELGEAPMDERNSDSIKNSPPRGPPNTTDSDCGPAARGSFETGSTGQADSAGARGAGKAAAWVGTLTTTAPPARLQVETGAVAGSSVLNASTENQALSEPSLTGSAQVSGILQLLPDVRWESNIVPYSTIQFCQNSDGSYAELGRGAFATVYRVLVDGEPHAAKVLHLGQNPKVQQMFIAESATMRHLRHRNIVSFQGVCVEGDSGIILMELMEGRDLHTKLDVTNRAGERTFGWYARGKTVAFDVARALAYLHRQHYTHFDVKSSNVLLSRDLTAKLGDVGFSRSMRTTHHSLSNAHTGTFDYMAPELLIGRHCTSSVDIYSFGVLLWEICAGEWPSRGSMRALHVPEEAPQEVADLVAACIEEDPAARPTAKELVQRLGKLQKQPARAST